MRATIPLILALTAAMFVVGVLLLTVPAGEQPQQSPRDAGNVIPSRSGADKGLFVPACTLDTTLWDMRSKDTPPADRKPSTGGSQAAPATHFMVGTFECQS